MIPAGNAEPAGGVWRVAAIVCGKTNLGDHRKNPPHPSNCVPTYLNSVGQLSISSSGLTPGPTCPLGHVRF